MCGRFVSSSPPDELAAYFGVDQVGESVQEADQGPNYNVAPTQDVLGVVEDDMRYLDAFHWGLIPSWAKDAKIGNRMINARAETLATSNAFKSSFAKRRCLVPADGFYEWKKLEGSGKKAKKQPMFIHRRDGEPIAFAGLWSVWRGADREQDPLRSLTIVTTTPNSTMSPIHDRMPVILPRSAWDDWLDRDNHDVERLSGLLVPATDDVLEVRPVSTEVNNVRNNGAHLVERAEELTGAG